MHRGEKLFRGDGSVACDVGLGEGKTVAEQQPRLHVARPSPKKVRNARLAVVERQQPGITPGLRRASTGGRWQRGPFSSTMAPRSRP